MAFAHKASSPVLAAALSASLVLACSHSQQEAVAPKGYAAPPTSAQPELERAANGDKKTGVTAPGDTAAPAPTERDPEALEALRRMGEFLRTQKAFVVRSETSTDEVLDTGQKIQFEGDIELKVRRPDRLRASIKSDRKQRQLYYDGKSFTLFGERIGYYATAPAPPTILELIDTLQNRFDIEFPLADLFRWGTEEGDEEAIVGASDIGPSRIRGVDTEQYAFRRADVDFQVWIEKGARPLPRKLVITTLDEPSQPQYASVLTWTLNPKLNDAEFSFVPPRGAQRIVFEETQP